MSFAGVFCLCAFVDILWINWTRSSVAGRALAAAGYSALIQLVGVVSILLVVDDRRLLVANVCGHAFGSYIGVKRTAKEPNGATDA